MRNCIFIPAVFGFLFFSTVLYPQQRNAAHSEPAQGNPAQNEPQKFALVIGNGNYSGGLSKLKNPTNDADDISAILKQLGFTVEKVLNGSLRQMEDAVQRLRDRLSKSPNAYGFFFYAGHGVQSGGDNYLIPVNANIPNENYLRERALSVQAVLDDLNDAGNGLNVIVLDACRDNPFGWSRSGSRGLAMVTRQPADSIVVYATSAGQKASDGEGRNGLFTSKLITNLATPGLEVKEVFNRTGANVAEASGRDQIPAVYNQFFGTAYLNFAPVQTPQTAQAAQPPQAEQPAQAPKNRDPGKIQINPGKGSRDPACFWSVGAAAGSSLAAPWLIGTVHGTLAPFKHSFLEIGADYGLFAGDPDVEYYSVYPFANYAYFMPLDKFSLYAGAGGGLWIVSYKFFNDTEYSDTMFVGAGKAGVLLFDMINISYTLRTNFSGFSHKVSVGYSYRFK